MMRGGEGGRVWREVAGREGGRKLNYGMVQQANPVAEKEQAPLAVLDLSGTFFFYRQLRHEARGGLEKSEHSNSVGDAQAC